METVQTMGQGLGKDGEGAEGFRAVKLLCVVLRWWAHVITCCPAPQNVQPRGRLQCTLWLWMMMCQNVLINCKTCTILVGTLAMEKTVHV